jgi:hypothetical protein
MNTPMGARLNPTPIYGSDGNVVGLQASAALNDNDEAEVDIKKLLETDPNNREARELLKTVSVTHM